MTFSAEAVVIFGGGAKLNVTTCIGAVLFVLLLDGAVPLVLLDGAVPLVLLDGGGLCVKHRYEIATRTRIVLMFMLCIK